jgi:hypothetical protein
LEGAEASEVSLGIDHLLDLGCTESADQLVLEVCVADVEAKPFQLGASEVRAEAGSLEATPNVSFLSGVIETRKPEIEPVWAELGQKPSEGLRTACRNDGDALSVEVSATPLRKRFERGAVAHTFNEHDCARIASWH